MKAMKIVLGALVVLMALGGMAMATTTFTGQVDPSYIVNIPDTATVHFVLGENPHASFDGIGLTTNTANWKLTAIQMGGYSGQFYGAGSPITPGYKIFVDTVNDQYSGSGATDLSDNIGHDMATGYASGGAYSIPIVFNQVVTLDTSNKAPLTTQIQFAVGPKA